MPFTPAHAIATAPIWYLAGKRLPLPALVIGSLSPDFPYLISLTTVPAPGHSLSGLLAYCLIPSLIVLAIWYRWIERPMLSLLRVPSGPKRESMTSFVLLSVIAVLLGAATHAAWDSSSHGSGWLVQHNAWLKHEVANLPVYKWNQYLGGILGLIGIFYWYSIERSGTNGPLPTALQCRAAVGIFSASVIFFVCAAHLVHGSETFSEFAVRSAVGTLTGLAVGAIAYSAWVHFANAGPRSAA